MSEAYRYVITVSQTSGIRREATRVIEQEDLDHGQAIATALFRIGNETSIDLALTDGISVTSERTP